MLQRCISLTWLGRRIRRLGAAGRVTSIAINHVTVITFFHILVDDTVSTFGLNLAIGITSVSVNVVAVITDFHGLVDDTVTAIIGTDGDCIVDKRKSVAREKISAGDAK